MPNNLVFIPTYNEKDNIGLLFEQIQKLGLATDFLLLDDNSPDGTGAVIDGLASKNPNVHTIHRKGKLGIGSAHKDGIQWAYRHGYRTLITMDADFTHSPSSIPSLLEKSEQADVVVGSRYLQMDSLRGWNFFRKFLTRTAHVLTTVLLGLKYDSTGAFRVYRLDKIPEAFIQRIASNGYSFFFESLHFLNRSHFKIVEVPVALPPRTYGSSKMSYSEMLRSIYRLLTLWMHGMSVKPLELRKESGAVKEAL